MGGADGERQSEPRGGEGLGAVGQKSRKSPKSRPRPSRSGTANCNRRPPQLAGPGGGASANGKSSASGATADADLAPALLARLMIAGKQIDRQDRKAPPVLAPILVQQHRHKVLARFERQHAFAGDAEAGRQNGPDHQKSAETKTVSLSASLSRSRLRAISRAGARRQASAREHFAQRLVAHAPGPRRWRPPSRSADLLCGRG